MLNSEEYMNKNCPKFVWSFRRNAASLHVKFTKSPNHRSPIPPNNNDHPRIQRICHYLELNLNPKIYNNYTYMCYNIQH